MQKRASDIVHSLLSDLCAFNISSPRTNVHAIELPYSSTALPTILLFPRQCKRGLTSRYLRTVFAHAPGYSVASATNPCNPGPNLEFTEVARGVRISSPPPRLPFQEASVIATGALCCRAPRTKGRRRLLVLVVVSALVIDSGCWEGWLRVPEFFRMLRRGARIPSPPP